MRTQMVIRMHAKASSKAMKIAAQTEGVESVTLAGKDKNLLLVVGDGLDCNALTTKLRKKVGHADIVELHTAGAGVGAYNYVPRSDTLHDTGYYKPRADYGTNNYGYPTAAARYPPAPAATPEYYSSYNSYKPSYDNYKPMTYESYKPSYGNYNYNPPPPAYPATVVQHEYYPADDHNGCSIM